MWTLAAAATVAAFGCSGDPRLDDAPPPTSPQLDAGAGASPARACGDADDLPAGAVRDDAAHTVTLACDGDAKGLVVTVLDDGLVRLRYGTDLATIATDGSGGSLVPIERPPSTVPLSVGRRGTAAVLRTEQIELVIEPQRCTLVAKDLATGAVVLDDTGGGGFFRSANVVGVTHASPAGERFYGLGLHTATQAGQGLDIRGSVVEDMLQKTRRVRCSISSFSNLGAIVQGTALLATVPELVAAHLLKTSAHLRTTTLPFDFHGIPMELLWPAAVDEDDACSFLRAKIAEVVGAVGRQTLRRRETRARARP